MINAEDFIKALTALCDELDRAEAEEDERAK